MVDVIVVLAGIADSFGGMVVEYHMRAGGIGQVGGDIPRPDLDLSILHILGVNELDLVDHIEVFEQHGADQPIEITTCDQAEFLVFHSVPLYELKVGDYRDLPYFKATAVFKVTALRLLQLRLALTLSLICGDLLKQGIMLRMNNRLNSYQYNLAD